MNAYDYKITPCSNCNYECFKSPKSCPIQDDVPKIIAKVFSYRKYGTTGYKGDLAQNNKVISHVKHLADNMCQLLKQEGDKNI